MHRVRSLLFITVAIAILAVSQAAGMTVMPTHHNVNLQVSNDAGAFFDDYANESYHFFSSTQTPTMGMNALHITTDPAAAQSGQVTFSSEQSGTFYITDTGGRGWSDDGILMLAVNGTVPDNFQLHITASGYRWTPVPTGSYPAFVNITYVPVALDETFTRDDFLYGPQIWKPCTAPDYPIFDHQDMTDSGNTFSLLFIDLNAAIVGKNMLARPDFQGQSIQDSGAIKVDYSFENLNTFAAFDIYAYCVSSNQGQGVRWTNRLTDTGASGYSVVGVASPEVVPLPGFTNPPTDPDGDGIYEDLNANGELDFNDVQVFFRQMDWISENEPVQSFDPNHNDEIDFNDIQLLFREI